jgi:hypothetical protein
VNVEPAASAHLCVGCEGGWGGLCGGGSLLACCHPKGWLLP